MGAAFGVTDDGGVTSQSMWTQDGSQALIRAVSKLQVVKEHKGPIGLH